MACFVYNIPIMKSSIKKKTFQAIYRLLDRVSPLPTDCGALCGAACCNCGGDSSSPEAADFDMGIYLLPGEEKLFSRKEDWLKWSVEDPQDYDFPDSWHGKIYFVRCNCAPFCPREKRPLQCRFFPLAPHLAEDGQLVLIRCDLELPYICPLIEAKMELSPSFLKATYTVWRRLIKDPLIYDLVAFDSAFRQGSCLDVVYTTDKSL